jgi:hypothetical protein
LATFLIDALAIIHHALHDQYRAFVFGPGVSQL